ncbi:F-box domain-containing protein [Mycena indigotica]|uniref:F-box domain-containing protein n=1 Tax=Mycena indigotica TaxID=2126181 RepID=A0A8H6S0L5_9AGAR|nr:F-box domain-containing protein [Mycena indigotica]KAF7289707.1 F-box domain-containing protein [Mycena indigotica]
MFGCDAPTNLAQVCRNWRQAAYDTPYLWRALQLHLWHFQEGNFTAAENQVAAARAWLSRSGALPLSIFLHCSTDPTPLAPVLLEAFTLLLSHCSRWEYAYLMVPAALPADMTMPALPLLVQLEISVPRLVGGSAVQPLRWLPAPKLRTLDVRFGKVFPAYVLSPDSWKSLTILRVFGIQWGHAMEALSLATGLVSCWLQLHEDRLSRRVLAPSGQPLQLYLPHLETLALPATDPATVQLNRRLLDSLRVPALRSLAIDKSFIASYRRSHSVQETAHHFARLLDKWGCSMTLGRLTLLVWEQPPADLSDDRGDGLWRNEIHTALPAITDLEFRFNDAPFDESPLLFGSWELNFQVTWR